jgi:KUP system potassium uptake protein
MDSRSRGTPPALLHNLEHNQVLHDRVVLLTVVIREIPYVDAEERVEVERIGEDLYRMRVHFGFAEDPDVPRVLAGAEVDGEGFDLEETTFFLGRETLLATDRPGMALWREKLFSLMSRNAQRAADHFHIPSDRVVEVGTQVEL